MAEKRFDVGNLKIQDNAPKGRLYLLDMQGGVNALCSLINGLNDKSNRLEKENEKLKQENNKIKNVLLDKRKDLECAYDCAVKAGMPTGGTIGELDTIEDILEELGLKE